MLRPTLYLTFTLRGADATGNAASLIKRSFSYIAPTRIVGEPQGGTGGRQEQGNTIGLEVKLGGRDFWRKGEGDSDLMWRATLLPWLSTKLDTLFSTVAECNNERRKSFERAIGYRTLELTLPPYRIAVALEPDSSLRQLTGQLDAIQDWLDGQGRGRGEVVGFRVPCDAERGGADWFEVLEADGSSWTVRTQEAPA